MRFERIEFKTPVDEVEWRDFVAERRIRRPSRAPDRPLDIGEGGVLYNLLHGKYSQAAA